MGGTSTSTQTQKSSTNPYAIATPALNNALQQFGTLANTAGSLTGAQTGALNSIEANAGNNPYVDLAGNVTRGLLNGGGAQANDGAIAGALANYQASLAPFANGSMAGDNSTLKSRLDQIATDVRDQVSPMFVAAGRDGSGYHQLSLARGIAAGEAPVIQSQFNTDQQNQLNAIERMFSGATTGYGLLNGTQQTANSNAQAGAALAPAALNLGNWGANSILQAEAMRTGAPLQNLTTILGSVLPAAQAFGAQNGTTSGSQTMSGADQFLKIAQGIGSLYPKSKFA
jgi:hypothetical protein